METKEFIQAIKNQYPGYKIVNEKREVIEQFLTHKDHLNNFSERFVEEHKVVFNNSILKANARNIEGNFDLTCEIAPGTEIIKATIKNSASRLVVFAKKNSPSKVTFWLPEDIFKISQGTYKSDLSSFGILKRKKNGKDDKVSPKDIPCRTTVSLPHRVALGIYSFG